MNRPRFDIPLHRPLLGEAEALAAADSVRQGMLSGGGPHLLQAEARLAARLDGARVLATTSGTSALELALMLYGIGPGDEVILPAYNFPSAATAVLRQGASPVFAACAGDDLNVDPSDVEELIGPRTRAIIALHYGGVPCDMEALQRLASERELLLLEDAAHAFDARWRGRACGTLSDGGCLSFQGNKNLVCGEGGAFVTTDASHVLRAGRLREMGTDRAEFRTGSVAEYSWLDIGSSWIPADPLMAILLQQLERADFILERRRAIFQRYQRELAASAQAGALQLPVVRERDESNGHLFALVLCSQRARDDCQRMLREAGIEAERHFDDLSATPMGGKFRRSPRLESQSARSLPQRVLRIPLYPTLSEEEVDRVVEAMTRALAKWA